MERKIVWILVLCAAALLGFYMGFGDAAKRTASHAEIKFKISSQCVAPSPISNKNGEAVSWFSQCMCMISDDAHEPTWWDLESVNHLAFRAATADDALGLCKSGCEKLCHDAVTDALRANPDFKIPTRW